MIPYFGKIKKPRYEKKRGYPKLIRTVTESLLDTLFPQSAIERELTRMQPYYLPGKLTHSFTSPCPEIIPLFRYRNTYTRTAIHLLKYRGNRYISDLFGAVLYDTINSLITDRKVIPPDRTPLIVPIPASRVRRRNKTFNQTEFLCESILLHDHDHTLSYAPNILQKSRETPQQTTLKRKERLRNMKKSLAVTNPEKVDGQIVIVIDDVTTTGSTLLEARRALLHAGAEQVICLAVAH